MPEACFSEDQLRDFECQRCQLCCRQRGFVYVSSEESERIADWLGMDPYDFTEQYCEVQHRRSLVLKKNRDESCVFLDAKGCRIHSVKPVQCVEFPFKWRTPRSFHYCEGLKKLL